MDRLLSDAKLHEIGAGTSEIRRMLIGRQLFDETAQPERRGHLPRRALGTGAAAVARFV
jgi:hypothetical protein